MESFLAAAVYETVSDAVSRARDGEGPTFIEATTNRHKGHSRTDPAAHRPQAEVEEWLVRDPIPALERAMLDAGIDQGRVDEIRDDATTKVAEHLERALGWDDPQPERPASTTSTREGGP